MPLKPWCKVVTPREDLREDKPLDASELAVHPGEVRNGCAPPDYQKPDRFFARTYLARSLSTPASQVIRRPSGERAETIAAFGLTAQCAVWLLCRLAGNGSAFGRPPSVVGERVIR